jgi:hypothetical protein
MRPAAAAKLGLWSENVFFVIATRFEPVRSTAMISDDARRFAWSSGVIERQSGLGGNSLTKTMRVFDTQTGA